MVSLTKAGKRWRLNGMAIGPCPKDSWKPDVLENAEEIAKAVRTTMRQGKPNPIHGKNAMIALPESVIFSGTFSAPHMEAPELQHALPLLIAEKLSIQNIDDYYYDYEEIDSQCNPLSDTPKATDKDDKKATEPPNDEPTDEDEPSKNITIFAVAAKKSLVDSVVKMCESCGLKVVGIDIKPGAIARAVVDADDNKPRLIIDLGVGGTGASVTEGKNLRVTSIIPWGTNAIGENITGPVDDLKAKAAPVFDELGHITRFFENRVCPGVKIQEIIISGSGANITNIHEVFKQETGIPTKLADPFTKVDTGRFPVPKELFHTFSDSIGLAMREGAK
jgi:Tfp pilus assembly PilM family ATPase